MKKHVFYFLAAFSITLFSCQKEAIEGPVQPTTTAEDESYKQFEFEKEGRRVSSGLNSNSALKIMTFNVYGAIKSELVDFRDNYLNGDENVLCLQEVSNVGEVLEVFQSGPSHRNEDAVSAFPYYQSVENYTDKNFWGVRKRNNVVVLSKFPIVRQNSKLIQKDPGGDRWRRHAQYVRLKVSNTKSINLFHYHNTYNWHNNSSQSEKAGMVSFKAWVEQILGTSLSTSTPDVYLTGDFNLSSSLCKPILGNSLNYSSYFVDYVVSTNASISGNGNITVPASMSDHRPVWASFNSVSTNRYYALHRVVRVYEHSNFNGRVAAFEVGTFNDITNFQTLPGNIDFWNDRISSIISGGYVKLQAWEHNSQSGTKWCLPNVSGCNSSNFNDKISSIKVTN